VSFDGSGNRLTPDIMSSGRTLEGPASPRGNAAADARFVWRLTKWGPPLQRTTVTHDALSGHQDQVEPFGWCWGLTTMTVPETLPLVGNTGGGFCLQPTVEIAQRWP
jgi:hypothetical protein